tara:strand:- start:522 stop:1280 length:759 start_codon:yes stop_codon:yes gene_type:complete
MKVCLLEVGPKGPLTEIRSELLEDFGDDYFYVTHDEKVDGALSFNRGKCWAENRNYLAANVPRNYDYYWFTDYDVNYTTKKGRIKEQIVKDLESTRPAVMVCNDPSKFQNNTGGIKDTGEEYKNIAMSNNHMKIVHKDLLDWFFPMPTMFGGIHDCCHFFNVLETPFLESVICTFNVECKGMISEPRSQGGNMQAMHNYIEQAFGSELPKEATHQEFKSIMQNKSASLTPKNFAGVDNIKNYFNLNSSIFAK